MHFVYLIYSFLLIKSYYIPNMFRSLDYHLQGIPNVKWKFTIVYGRRRFKTFKCSHQNLQLIQISVMLSLINITSSWIQSSQCCVVLCRTSQSNANFSLCLFHIVRYCCIDSCEVKHGILNLLCT